MIGVSAILLAQAGGIAMLEADRVDYEPYRKCVVERATLYANSSESVPTIADAAMADCRTVKAITIGKHLEHMLDRETPEETGRLDNSKAVQSNKNFDEFDEMLKQDVAATVLRRRVK